MKTLILLSFVLATNLFASAQDKIVRHNGDTIDGKVLRVTEMSIVFRYAGEESEHFLGKYAAKEIVYSSGRKEPISEKVIINGKEDWEKVQVVEEKEYLEGLKKGEQVRGKTSGVAGFHTANTADKKAMKKLKEAAAEAGAPFVLITADNDARALNVGIGTAQGVKRGILYTYK
jgi:hypothetical protein